MSGVDGKHRVSIVAVPDAMASTLSGIYDVFSCFTMLSTHDDAVPRESPFRVEVVAAAQGRVETASGVPFVAERPVRDVEKTDIVILPSLMIAQGEWRVGRYPEIVRWLESMYRRGATLCSACSGVLLLAETGLLDGHEATMHWAYAPTFRRNFPNVALRLEQVLVTAGDRDRLVTSGTSTSWHDLVLYLVARYVGPTIAQSVARFFAFQLHADGLAPYIGFEPRMDHGDAVVRAAQLWLRSNFSAPKPVEELVRNSGLPERTFKRRFKKATEHAPIEYVQKLRIEDAKRRLERTESPVDDIGWAVGYEDAAFFRRLFKRITGMTPAAYRRKFKVAALGAEAHVSRVGRST